jgi:hypothetical protein
VDEAVDIFYCVVGYLRSCHLESDYEVRAPEFAAFVTGLLTNCFNAEDFDAHQFVWLVESIREHFYLGPATFRTICEALMKVISDGRVRQTGLRLLNSVSIVSTSPSLQQFSVLAETVNSVFKTVVQDVSTFIHKYLFGCFIGCLWEGQGSLDEPPDQLSCPLRLWKLYLANLVARVSAYPDLPDVIIVAFLEESIIFLSNYYGEVQPSREYSVKLRMDLLEAIALYHKYYPGNMDAATKKKLWYLLYIVAISGCSDADLKEIQQKDLGGDDLYLGIGHTDRELVDYSDALSKLSAKFISEAEVFQAMIQFIRTNY